MRSAYLERYLLSTWRCELNFCGKLFHLSLGLTLAFFPCSNAIAAEVGGYVGDIPEELADYATMDDVKSYWSESKIADALDHPVDVLSDGSGHFREGDSTMTLSGSNATEDLTSTPTGYLLFRNGTQNQSCTASLVGNGDTGVVVTAAHCLHGGAGKGWYSNLTFAPNLAPSGGGQITVPLEKAVVLEAWKSNANTSDGLGTSEISNDIGFAVLDSRVPVSILDIYKRNIFGRESVTSEVRIFGYNAAHYATPESCVADASPEYKGGIRLYKSTGCGFSDWNSSNGGPWIRNYKVENNRVGTGTIVGITVATDGKSLFSPLFGSGTHSLYEVALSAAKR